MNEEVIYKILNINLFNDDQLIYDENGTSYVVKILDDLIKS